MDGGSGGAGGGKGIDASASAGGVGTSASVLTRNSLGDPNVSARTTRAQVGLRRDLGMVREFDEY